jgi:hypothetical protein
MDLRGRKAIKIALKDADLGNADIFPEPQDLDGHVAFVDIRTNTAVQPSDILEHMPPGGNTGRNYFLV